MRRLKQQPALRGATDLGLIYDYVFVVLPFLGGHGPTLLAGLRQPTRLEQVERRDFRSGRGGAVLGGRVAAGTSIDARGGALRELSVDSDQILFVTGKGKRVSDIEVSAAIEALRQELSGAIESGNGQKLRFALGDIQLELTTVLTSSANGKVGWKILELGGSLQNAQTQKLSITLSPRVGGPHGELTSDVVVSGTAESGPASPSQWAHVTPEGPDE